MNKIVICFLCLFTIFSFGLVSVSADTDLTFYEFTSSDVLDPSVDSNTYKILDEINNLIIYFHWDSVDSVFYAEVLTNSGTPIGETIASSFIFIDEDLHISSYVVDVDVDNPIIPLQTSTEINPIYQGIYDLYLKLIYGDEFTLSSTDIGILTYLSVITTILVFMMPMVFVIFVIKKVLD